MYIILIVMILIIIAANININMEYNIMINFISRSAESRLYPHRGRPLASSSQFRQRRAAPAAPAAGSAGASCPAPAAPSQIIPLTQPAEQLW